MKLIDMEKVLSELCLSHKDIIYIDKNETAERIRKIPSIEIEPKRGEWKRMKFTDCGLPVDKCSICGHYINGDVEVRNFCPNCGARMKGADDFVKTHEVVVNGNCAICGKPLNGTKLFLCEGCSEKGVDDE